MSAKKKFHHGKALQKAVEDLGFKQEVFAVKHLGLDSRSTLHYYFKRPVFKPGFYEKAEKAIGRPLESYATDDPIETPKTKAVIINEIGAFQELINQFKIIVDGKHVEPLKQLCRELMESQNVTESKLKEQDKRIKALEKKKQLA